MEFKKVVGNRRSIRYYQPWRDVEREKIQTILEAARLASRVMNAPYPKPVVVYRKELSEAEVNSFKTPTTTAQLDMAPVWIFWYANMDALKDAHENGTLHGLVDVGALNPSHGWSHSYIEDIVWAQLLHPLSSSKEIMTTLVSEETALAICQALLCAVDEGLGTQLVSCNFAVANEMLGVPSNYIPVWVQLLGYPAEDPQTGGQRPRETLEEMASEGKFGNPFVPDPKVTEKLREAGMIQDTAPAPWRQAELRALAHMLDLPE